MALNRIKKLSREDYHGRRDSIVSIQDLFDPADSIEKREQFHVILNWVIFLSYESCTIEIQPIRNKHGCSWIQTIWFILITLSLWMVYRPVRSSVKLTASSPNDLIEIIWMFNEKCIKSPKPPETPLAHMVKYRNSI